MKKRAGKELAIVLACFSVIVGLLIILVVYTLQENPYFEESAFIEGTLGEFDCKYKYATVTVYFQYKRKNETHSEDLLCGFFSSGEKVKLRIGLKSGRVMIDYWFHYLRLVLAIAGIIFLFYFGIVRELNWYLKRARLL